MNSTTTDIHGSAPFTLLYGRPVDPAYDDAVITPAPTREQLKKLDKERLSSEAMDSQLKRVLELTGTVWPAIRVAEKGKQARMKERVDKNLRVLKNPYPVGSLVMSINERRASEMFPPWMGPYEVLSYSSHTQSYTLKDLEGNLLSRTLPAHKLKLIKAGVDESRWTGGRTPYEVEMVVDARIGTEGYKEYLTKWKRHSIAQCTWEPFGSFLTSHSVTKYERTIYPAVRSNNLKSLPVATQRIMTDYLKMKSTTSMKADWKDQVLEDVCLTPSVSTSTRKRKRGATEVIVDRSEEDVENEEEVVSTASTAVLRRNASPNCLESGNSIFEKFQKEKKGDF
jgi:hypothetical protein